MREWLQSLTQADKRILGEDIKTVEYGWPIGMPLCRSMGNGLREMRSTLPHGIARILFCVSDGSLVLLHGFIKKTDKTPVNDLTVARNRMREVLR